MHADLSLYFSFSLHPCLLVTESLKTGMTAFTPSLYSSIRQVFGQPPISVFKYAMRLEWGGLCCQGLGHLITSLKLGDKTCSGSLEGDDTR